MSTNRYSNFVRPSGSNNAIVLPTISGEEAKRIYLEEIKEASNSRIPTDSEKSGWCDRTHYKNIPKVRPDVCKKDLFLCAENNDLQRLIDLLECCPNMINITDDYGWSLLMIACQANSVDVVRELIKQGINCSIRDKAGNSARSLVIKNRNLALVDILLSYKSNKVTCSKNGDKLTKHKSKLKQRFLCEICNKTFPDKEEHLSSTVHNISASKDKKIPTSYVIPASNKGYQLMLKTGWDRDSGLGPDGSGKKYPIKTVQKKDRKGLGLDKRKFKEEKSIEKHVNKRLLDKESKSSINMEINFRRQFY